MRPSTDSERSIRSHLGAIITGLAAVFAAAVAGYWTADASRESVRQQTSFDAARLDEQARGSARVLINEFLISANEMTDLAMNVYLDRFGRDYPVNMPNEDLRLIASRLSNEEWTWVSAALSDVEQLGRYVTQRSRRAHPLAGRPLSRHSVNIIARDLESVGRATEALQHLADLEGVPVRTLDADAAFARVREVAADAGVEVPE